MFFCSTPFSIIQSYLNFVFQYGHRETCFELMLEPGQATKTNMEKIFPY